MEQRSFAWVVKSWDSRTQVEMSTLGIQVRKSCGLETGICEQLALGKEGGLRAVDPFTFFRNQLRKERRAVFFLPLYDLKLICTPSLDVSYIIHLFLW